MPNQSEFMKAIQELADYAELNGGVLTKTEVEESIRGMELTESQYDLVYRYLFEKKITIQGIQVNVAPEKEHAESQEEESILQDGEDVSPSAPEPIGKEDSVYLKMYLEELEDLEKWTEPERLQLAMQLLDGREEAAADLLNATLYQVVEIARGYCGRGALLEDLIQEGNIGLMQVLKELTGKKKQEEPLLYIKEYIQYTLEQYLDEELQSSDKEEQVLAKMGLLHEAAKVLSEENGVLPTAKELAEYTRIPEEEIQDMVSLTNDVSLIHS